MVLNFQELTAFFLLTLGAVQQVSFLPSHLEQVSRLFALALELHWLSPLPLDKQHAFCLLLRAIADSCVLDPALALLLEPQ